MYRERSSRLPGAYVWTSAVADETARILPDGCIDLIWNDGDVFVAGPDTEAQLFNGVPGSAIAGLRFAPGFGPHVVGVPARELANRRVPLDALWAPAKVRRVADRLGSSEMPGVTLEDIALELRPDRDPEHGIVDHVVELARRDAPVAVIADTVGLSARQLQRRCADAFGYGAKTLARILRMQRALDLACRGAPLADTASRAGYADQAHLAREVKDLAGVPVGQLIR